MIGKAIAEAQEDCRTVEFLQVHQGESTDEETDIEKILASPDHVHLGGGHQGSMVHNIGFLWGYSKGCSWDEYI